MSSETNTTIDKDFVMVKQCLSTDSSDTAPKDIQIPDVQYQEIYTPYLKNKPSYMLAEGVGIHASYSLKGHVALRGNTLFVSGMGKTAASRVGSVSWFITATLREGDIVLEEKNLVMEGLAAWPEDDFDPIGHASFTLPLPPRRLNLVLTGGHFYTSGTGHLAAGTVDIPFDIEVETR